MKYKQIIFVIFSIFISSLALASHNYLYMHLMNATENKIVTITGGEILRGESWLKGMAPESGTIIKSGKSKTFGVSKHYSHHNFINYGKFVINFNICIKDGTQCKACEVMLGATRSKSSSLPYRVVSGYKQARFVPSGRHTYPSYSILPKNCVSQSEINCHHPHHPGKAERAKYSCQITTKD